MGFYDGNIGYSKEFQITGIKETNELFQQMAEEMGDKKATSKFIVPMMRKAMAPVLVAARLLAPRDTGLLANNLTITAKRPSQRDKRSKYVSQGDIAIAKVEVKPIKAKDKKDFTDLTKSLATKNIKTNKKKFMESGGYFYDARAIANEFGTAKRAAKPFLRPALEGQASQVIELLSLLVNQKILQYRSKTIK